MINDNELLYEKSNYLITGRHHMSRMAQRLVAYSLTKIRARRNEITELDKLKGISVTFTRKEIEENIIGKSRGTLSAELKELAENLRNYGVFINEGSEKWKLFSIIKTAEYNNAEFTINYHEEMTPFIVDLKSNFTVLDYRKVKKLKHNASIRMYELCESLAYRTKATGSARVIYHFVELKLMLGIINAEDKAIKEIVNRNKKNYDKIAKELEELQERTNKNVVKPLNDALKELERDLKAIDPEDKAAIRDKKKAIKEQKERINKAESINPYSNGTNFRRKVLDVAKAEIDELFNQGEIDIRFQYEVEVRNRKIHKFNIIIINRVGDESIRKGDTVLTDTQMSLFDDMLYSNQKVEVVPKSDVVVEAAEIDTDDLLDQLKDLLLFGGKSLKLKDLRKILEVAENDSNRIVAAYDVVSKIPMLKNPVGAMISAIREGWEISESIVNNVVKPTIFNHFEQREYNYDELVKNINAGAN